MDERIKNFILGQKNLTLCTSENNQPYCASCFYAFIREENILVFKSAKTTKHISQALVNNKVAGTILPDLDDPGTIKGIQFTGIFIPPIDNHLEKLRKVYYKKFPFARAVAGDLWVIELISIKMTENTLGFGKKIIWEKYSVIR